MFRQFSHATSYTAYGENAIVSPVSALLYPCCPSAIFRAVISVVVYSVKCKLLRSFSHVREKVFKITPSLAHFYSTPAIIGKLFVLRIIAAHKYLRPYMPRRTYSAFAGMSVFVVVICRSRLRMFGRHGIGSFFAVLSGGCSADTGTRCVNYSELIGGCK